jgi:hypothetical protein
MRFDCDGEAARPEAEVQCRFDGRWVGGFEIADVSDDHVLVPRRSDGSTLPVAFPAEDIRSGRSRESVPPPWDD